MREGENNIFRETEQCEKRSGESVGLRDHSMFLEMDGENCAR